MAGMRGWHLHLLLCLLVALASLAAADQSSAASTNSADSTSSSSDNGALTTLTKHITTTDSHHHKVTSTLTTVISSATSAAAATTAAATTSTTSSTITSSSSTAATAAATHSPAPDNGPFSANMSTGTAIGAGIGFLSLFLILAACITLWIRHRNKRKQIKYYEEEEKRLSSWPSDIQQPFPQDPRAFRHTLWAPEYRSDPPSSATASPLRAHPHRSGSMLSRLNGLSKKSLPPLPEM